MKFIGSFGSSLINHPLPENFLRHEGFYCDKTPASINVRGDSVSLLGNVYSIPGFNGSLSDSDEMLKAILKAFQSGDGKEELSLLDGDFTLVIRDQSGTRTSLFREFKGSGPQIFYNDDFFSNDLHLLLEVSGQAAIPDLDALAFFLMYGFTPPEKSGIRGVKRLAGGHLLSHTKIGPEVTRIQSPAGTEADWSDSESAGDHVQTYLNLHTRAINNRIMNKSKIGLLLSGGYDSGGNLAGLRDIYGGKLNSYTISFKDNTHSELEFTRLMANEFGSDLKHYEIDGSEIAYLPHIVRQTGVPFQESGLMINYLVMRSVAVDNLDIVLGGDGNDQMFGTESKAIALRWLVNVTRLDPAVRFLGKIAGENESDNFMRKLNHYTRKIDRVFYPDRWGFNGKQLAHVPTANVMTSEAPLLSTSYERLFEYRRVNVDLAYTAFNVVLFKASQMAQLFGVSLAFPYLARDVFNFVDNLPLQSKVKGTLPELFRGKGVTKYIHKEAYRNRIPEQISSRKKQGGFVPLSMFFKDSRRNNELFDLIRESNLLDELLIDKQAVLIELKTAIADPGIWFWYQQVYYSRLLNMLVLAVWERIYLQKQIIEKI